MTQIDQQLQYMSDRNTITTRAENSPEIIWARCFLDSRVSSFLAEYTLMARSMVTRSNGISDAGESLAFVAEIGYSVFHPELYQVIKKMCEKHNLVRPLTIVSADSFISAQNMVGYSEYLSAMVKAGGCIVPMHTPSGSYVGYSIISHPLFSIQEFAERLMHETDCWMAC